MTDRELDAWLAEHLNRWDWDAVYHEARAPLFSSTGDGMLLVLEAMVKAGFTYEMDEGCAHFWLTDGEHEVSGMADAASLPRAVAEAAKAALEA